MYLIICNIKVLYFIRKYNDFLLGNRTTVAFNFFFFVTFAHNPFFTMNNLDLIILIPIALGFVFGLFKGLIKELASLSAIVLGIYGAKAFAPSLSRFLIYSFSFSTQTALPVAYIILFVVISVVLLIVAKSLDKFFDSIALGGLNKLLGGFFAAFKYALIVSVLLNIFDALDNRFPIIKPKSKTESIGYKPIMKLAPVLWEKSKKGKVFEFKKNSVNEEEIQNHR
jgi:membrane protein required for colicin V production